MTKQTKLGGGLRFTGVRQFSRNLGPIWVRYAGSKNSLEDQERAVSTVEIQ
jgi:hypothetical protein